MFLFGSGDRLSFAGCCPGQRRSPMSDNLAPADAKSGMADWPLVTLPRPAKLPSHLRGGDAMTIAQGVGLARLLVFFVACAQEIDFSPEVAGRDLTDRRLVAARRQLGRARPG